MVRIGLGLRVTRDAREHAVVIGIRVAIGAQVPASRVASRIDREVLQVVPGRVPVGCRVALRANGREARALMIRIGRVEVVALMTEITVGGRALELSVDVAQGTRDVDMGAGQRERRVAVVKGCRGPAVRRMADRAVVIVIARDVIGIGYALVIRLVAGPAVRRSALELSVYVTQIARNINVRSGQRERRVAVIEG